MKNRLISHFIKKTTVKVIIFAVLMFIVAAVGQSMSPVISNNMALGQMQNSDEMYILMDTYYKVRPIVSAAFAGIILLFTGSVARDIFKLVKTINTENEKEN